MNFMDQVIAYKLIKNAITPQTWIRALKGRIRRLARKYPEAARRMESDVRGAIARFKGRKAFTPQEYEKVRKFTKFWSRVSRPVRAGVGGRPVIPVAAPTHEEALRRLRIALKTRKRSPEAIIREYLR
ncbi:MAG: hypothetical protein QXI71_06900 [Candidatus Bathyarchaeia archaeon]